MVEARGVMSWKEDQSKVVSIRVAPRGLHLLREGEEKGLQGVLRPIRGV
ncbi:MAG: hypothetical protein ACTSVD_10010 [Candidatus Thorarchaeota archaeon]